jgi:hypothetical protein
MTDFGLPNHACVDGQGTVASKALLLSLTNGLFVLPTDKSDILSRTYGCLYGFYTVNAKSIAIIPDQILAVASLQVVFSALCLFLVLLGLRNHFRIQ